MPQTLRCGAIKMHKQCMELQTIKCILIFLFFKNESTVQKFETFDFTLDVFKINTFKKFYTLKG